MTVAGRRRVVAAVAWAILGWGGYGTAPADAGAVVTGIGSQSPSLFASRMFGHLRVRSVRLDVPWDAGLRHGPWQAWLRTAHRRGLTVLLALDHGDGTDCPYRRCRPVALARYRAAFAALHRRYPWITEYEAWNEPNDNTEPTADHPAMAAAYHDAAQRACPRCTVIAGDLLDGPDLESYLRAYRAALHVAPRAWGLHNYFDATYFESQGVDTMLTSTSAPLWLTETGGLLTDAHLSRSAAAAGQSIDWLYRLAARHRRITHMFLYSWQQGRRGASFDSGLLARDGAPRPSYWAVRAHTAASSTPNRAPGRRK